jgi:hypothetical protein
MVKLLRRFRMKNNIIDHWKLVAILVLCLVSIAGGCLGKSTQQSRNNSSTITEKAIPQRPLANKGDTKSKEEKVESPGVMIKAYLNIQSGCQGEIIELLESFQKTYPKKVKTEYIDFGTKEGLKQTLKDNLHCMAILINGKQTFELGNKTVTFSHPMGVQWTAEDLKMAVKQEIAKMYK